MTARASSRCVTQGLAWTLVVSMTTSVPAWDREEWEEPAGASFQFFFNPRDDVYGIAFGDGTWLVNTPVFGDYFLSVFHSRLEDRSFLGLGMTLRLLPHTSLAPFLGGGGSYNLGLGEPPASRVRVTAGRVDATTVSRGASFWSAHAEAGLRLWLANRLRLLELMVRHLWTSNDRDYWIVALSTGTGF